MHPPQIGLELAGSANDRVLADMDPIRSSAACGMNGPTSFSTSRRIGVFGWAASIMPISPPIEVPTQSTSVTSSRAISAAASPRYCG